MFSCVLVFVFVCVLVFTCSCFRVAVLFAFRVSERFLEPFGTILSTEPFQIIWNGIEWGGGATTGYFRKKNYGEETLQECRVYAVNDYQ